MAMHKADNGRASQVAARYTDSHHRMGVYFAEIEQDFERLIEENALLHARVEELEAMLMLNSDDPNAKIANRTALHSTKFLSSTTDGMPRRRSIKMPNFSRSAATTTTSRLAVGKYKYKSSDATAIRELTGHTDGVWEVSVCPQQPLLVCSASADGFAKLWNSSNSTCVAIYAGHRGSVNSVRMHPTENMACSASGDGSVHVWATPLYLSTNLSQRRQHDEQSQAVDSDSASPDIDIKFSKLAYESEEAIIVEPLYWRQPNAILNGHTLPVTAAEWFSAGKKIVSGSWDTSAAIWDVESGAKLQALTGHEKPITNITASGELILTSSEDTTFRLWDFRIPSMHAVNVFQSHTGSVNSAVFAGDDGNTLISGSEDRTVKIWDARKMRLPLVAIQNDAAVNRIAVSPSQKEIAVPFDNRHIRIYSVTGGRVLRLQRRQGHRRLVTSVCWAPPAANNDSKVRLYSSSFDGNILGWSLPVMTV